MKKTLLALTAGVALTALTGTAMAGGMMNMGGGMMKGGMFSGRMMMQKFDSNGDGVITREEAMAARDKMFTESDTDKNGSLNAAEIDAAIAKRMQRMMVRMRYRMLGKVDANGDGVISKDEMETMAKNRFAMADKNGDGKITRDEIGRMGMGMRGRGMGHMRRMMMHMKGKHGMPGRGMMGMGGMSGMGGQRMMGMGGMSGMGGN